MLDILDLTDPKNMKIIRSKTSKLAPIPKRSNTIEVKGSSAPCGWHLDGNLKNDPITESLMVRSNEGLIAGSAKQAPKGHVIISAPAHRFEVKQGMLDVFDFTDPDNADKVIKLGSKLASIPKR